MKILSKNSVVAIDIGTTKICVIIAEKEENRINILGIGKAPSNGLARGVVVNVGPAVESIKHAIKEAELMAGCTIESACIGISGSHINSVNSHGMIPIKHGDIRAQDVERVIKSAKAIPLQEGEKILHVIPQFFTIDSHQRVRDPVGMHGVRLEAQVHIITGGVTSVQNLVRCCELAGVKVRDIILEPLASAQAVLSSDERELGVAMLDIGGGTADLAFFHGGSIRHTKIIPIAGQMFTNDIALCLRTTRSDAEHIKRTCGYVGSQPQITQPLTITNIDGETTRTIEHTALNRVLLPRAQELLGYVQKEIQTYSLNQFCASGIVITGGGSLLHGIDELAKKQLIMPSRLGKPKVPYEIKDSLMSPIYATGYGLILYTLEKNKKAAFMSSGNVFKNVFWRMKSWIADFF